MSQMLLTMSTERCSVRADAVGWSCDDSSLYAHGQPVGLTPAPQFNYCYPNVLAAMADGWKLLAPPMLPELDAPGDDWKEWRWWLVKESE